MIILKEFFQNLIDPSWLFRSVYYLQLKSAIILSIIFLLVIITGIIFWFVLSKYEKTRTLLYQDLKEKIFTSLIVYGIIGLLIVFVAYEAIPYLSMPFWLILWFILFIIWKVKTILYYYLVFQNKIKNFHEAKVLSKYLPKERKK